jgi:hypothetical protein
LWIDQLAAKVQQLRAGLEWLPAEEIAYRSATSLEGGELSVVMLFDEYRVDTSSYVVTADDGEEANSFLQSLVLTYLHAADGTPAAGRWISFRELPNGAFYNRAFQGYAADRLAKRWELNLEGFADACRAVGGRSIDHGDAGFAFPVLPRVDIAAVYWLGDEDFPSKASVLFDANAHHYMVVDGLAILGSRLVDRILAAGS